MLVFYWYPKCSTCKKAKAWLDENKIAYETIDMIEQPPAKSLLEKWMAKSELPVRRFFNTSGGRYREQGLKEKVNTFSEAEAATLLATDGMLIKRPILVDKERVLLGFKENEYETMLK